MKRLTLTKVVLVLAFTSQGNADVGWAKLPIKPIIVAVIDTGLDPQMMKSKTICKMGHKDFTGKGLEDNHGHGTHISGLIDQYAKNFTIKSSKDGEVLETIYANYCQVIIKYYDPKAIDGNNLKNTIKSFRWAIDLKVDVINYSGGGTDFSEEEKLLITEALDKGIKVVAAAGNERSNIDKGKYYPAMYDPRIFIVGNLVSEKVEVIVTKTVDEKTRIITVTETTKRDIASSSNYGISINTWELGTNIYSRLPRGSYGVMTGTSQSAAIKSGKLIREMLQPR